MSVKSAEKHGNPGRLYVVGGRQRKLLFKNEDEAHLYEAALILQIDPADGSARTCVEYQSPPEARAGETSSVLFKSGTLCGNKLYVCTSTEVLVFEIPSFKRMNYISLPCFNDLHHVTPSQDGNLLVANTGLEMVVKFDATGNLLAQWDVLGDAPWARFSSDTDYRQIASTKPHRSHPNFVFELGTEVWVTRFMQRDAVCLTSPGRRIDISLEAPHDGVTCGDNICFTTVDGKIVIVGRDDLRIKTVVNLDKIDNEGKALLGWCRSLLPVDDRLMWVGFTRVRKTAFKENLLWVKHRFRETENPTHLALYDLVAGKRLREIDLEQYGMNVVFGIYPVPT